VIRKRIPMSIISEVLKEELERNLMMQSAYIKEIDVLPKGSIIRKKIGNGTYLYLLFRDNGKVHTKYLGVKEKVKIEEVENKINKRKYMHDTLKNLLKEEKEISAYFGSIRTPITETSGQHNGTSGHLVGQQKLLLSFN
jgi:hypothetical protein